MPHQQAVDGEVPALHVSFCSLRIDHAVRVAPVAVAEVRPERGHFHFQAILGDQDHAKLRPHRDALRKQTRHLDRRRIGRDVKISRLASQ